MILFCVCISSGAVSLPGGFLSSVSLPSVLSRVQCDGTESLLSDCRADNSPTGSCGDAAVLCQSTFSYYCHGDLVSMVWFLDIVKT